VTRVIHGYACKWDGYACIKGRRERFHRGAFKRALHAVRIGAHDVQLCVEHDANDVLASTADGTLDVFENDVGLRYVATLPPGRDGRIIAAMVRARQFRGASPAFCIRHELDVNGTRIIAEALLIEVSITPRPAYIQSTVHLLEGV
jgi:HK97 family phage prohead protease